MTVGIFGGSFDPIHEGHVNLAKYVLDHSDLDEVWLMVSPLNPLKQQGYVATNEQRLEMARLAVEGLPGIRVSDFEFHLPIPSYTYKTLTELKQAYPDIDFRLIIGGDNWANFEKWKNPDEILSEFGIIVYPRPGESLMSVSENGKRKTENVIILDAAPQMPISSTEIRHLLQSPSTDNGQRTTDNVSHLNPKVLNYINSHHLY